MKKIIFVQPHPDDLELNCGHLMHFLANNSKKKYVIKVASTTLGEYGLPGAQYDKFKGDFLAKVRLNELQNALSIHGIPAENITYLGYIDGLVPFNEEIISTFVNYLKKEQPDIIFGPEAIYTSYYHLDHVNTGRVLFYCIHHDLIGCRPILYYYQTLSPNFYFGFKEEDFNLIDQLLACHKTQFWLINRVKIMYKPKSRIAGLSLGGWKYAEKYRRVYFNKKNQNKNKSSLRVKIRSHWYSSMPWFQAKYPQDILKELNKKS